MTSNRHWYALQLQVVEQGFEGCTLVGFAGVKQGRGDRHTKRPGVERHLGDKARGAISAIKLRGWTPQRFAVADQLLDFPVLLSDLSEHPLPEQTKELLHFHPHKQIGECGVAGRIGHLHVQYRGKRLVVPSGKALQIPSTAATDQNAQNRHQQQQPLGVAHPTAFATFRQGLQEGDQISIGNGLDQGSGAVPTKPAPAWPRQLPCA
jgi:hypothetical protein